MCVVRATTEIRKARPHEGWESSKKNASHRREIGNEETCSVTHSVLSSWMEELDITKQEQPLSFHLSPGVARERKYYSKDR